MLALTLNPGFVLLLAGLLSLAAPRVARPATMAGAAGLALWLLLDHEFGAAAAMAQMGLPVVLLDLDALNRIFGIALMMVMMAVALSTNSRSHRYEDAAILVTYGAAVSALFVGDLISFVAAASLSGLAGAGIVFCSPRREASAAGARLLIWRGLEGLLFLVGVAFHLAHYATSSMRGALDIQSNVGALFIFLALLVRVGAPLAHVWFVDAVSNASPAGGLALTPVSTMIGVYGLARLFAAEPLLGPIGVAMMIVGAVYACAEDDLRRAGAYALTAQVGLSVALIGDGSPLALAAAEGGAFAAIFAYAAYQGVLGGIAGAVGSARRSSIGGLAATMPLSTFMLLVSGLAISSIPGFALYATQAVAIEALKEWENIGIRVAATALPAVIFVALTLWPCLNACRPSAKAPRALEAPFTLLLGAGLAVFFSIMVGLTPRWLYDLMPAQLSFEPFALDRLARTLEVLGAAGAIAVAFYAIGWIPRATPTRLLDIDAFYRGPLSGAARWGGVVLLRLHGSWDVVAQRLSQALGARFGGWLARQDNPYAAGGAGALQLAVIAAVLALALVLR